jgi:N-acetyl-anhydromuramyl-L-alanine amidase AmpD
MVILTAILAQLVAPTLIDAPLPIRNKEFRDTTKNYIILHNDGGGNYNIARRTLIKRRLSYHYYIKTDGTIIKLLDPKYQASHVGYSYWNGMFRINRYSIGICFENNGNTNFTNKQYYSSAWLITELQKRFPDQTSHTIIGHSDVALPLGRKADPGKLFDWKRLQYNMGNINESFYR